MIGTFSRLVRGFARDDVASPSLRDLEATRMLPDCDLEVSGLVIALVRLRSTNKHDQYHLCIWKEKTILADEQQKIQHATTKCHLTALGPRLVQIKPHTSNMKGLLTLSFTIYLRAILSKTL